MRTYRISTKEFNIVIRILYERLYEFCDRFFYLYFSAYISWFWYASKHKHNQIINLTLDNDQLNAQNFNTFITILYMYMFRAISCSSSGGQTVLTQHLVSSLSVSDSPVHELRKNSFFSYLIKQPTRCTIYLKFIVLSRIHRSTCFGHCCAHHQEPTPPRSLCNHWLPYDCRVGCASSCGQFTSELLHLNFCTSCM
jgi:hypothetical protein